MATEFTQQQLRSLSQSARKEISMQQAQQEAYNASVEQYNRDQVLSQQQKDDLQNRIDTLKSQITELESRESNKNVSSKVALEASAQKYGKQVELQRVEELSGKIASGGYFSNYSELLANTLAEGKVVSSNAMIGFTPALQKAQKEYQVSYEKVYLDELGNPISIAPSIAEERIRQQNLEAEKKMSIAPSIAYLNPPKVTQASIVSVLTTNPQTPKGKAIFGVPIPSQKTYDNKALQKINQAVTSYGTWTMGNIASVTTKPIGKLVRNEYQFQKNIKVKIDEAKKPYISYITPQSREQAYKGFTGSGDVRTEPKLTIFEKADILEKKTAESKIGMFFKKQQGNELPYGITPAQNIVVGKIGEEEAKIVRGEKFNLFLPSFYLGAQGGKFVKMAWEVKDEKLNPTFSKEERMAAYGIPSSFNPNSQLQLTISDANVKPYKIDSPSYVSGGTATGTYFKKDKKGFVRYVLDRDVSIQKGSVGGLLTSITAGLQLGTFFSPAMQTGTSGALERQAQGNKGALTKEQLKSLKARELLAEAQKRLIKEKTLAGQERELTKFIKEFKLTNSEVVALRIELYNSGVLKPIVLNPTVPTSTTGLRDITLGPIRDGSLGKIGGEISAKIGSTGNINTNFGIGAEILSANPNLVNMKYAGAITGTTGFLSYKLKVKDTIKKAAKTAPVIGYALKEVSATKTDIIPKQAPKQTPRTSSSPALSTAQVPKLTESLATSQQPRLSSATSSTLLSNLLSATSQISSQTPRQTQPQRESTKTRRIIKIPLLPKGAGGKELVKVKKEDGYEAFIYKGGKAKSIGTFDLLPSASKKLGTELTETLAASGFITQKGKKLKATELGLLGDDFRLSKTGSPYLVVEKKSKRLRKGSTGKEIQFFR